MSTVTTRCSAINNKGSVCKKNKIGETSYCTAHTESLQCTAIIKGSKCKCLKIGNFDFCRTHRPRETCSICLSPVENEFRLKTCGHAYCSDCIAEWFSQKPNCPYCRSSIDKWERDLVFKCSTLFKPVTIIRYDFTGISMEKAEEIMIKSGLYSSTFPTARFKEIIFGDSMEQILKNDELKLFFDNLPTQERSEYFKISGPVPKRIYQMVFPY